jgi:transcription factor STE12
VEEDGLEGLTASQYAENMRLNMAGIDFNQCEVEVNEGAQVIQFSDEEEILNAHLVGGNGYYSVDTPQFAHVVMSPENSPHLVSGALQNESSSVQWATQQQTGFDAYASPQPSPAFSSASAPSPQGGSSMSHNVAAMMLNAPTSGNYRMHGNDYAGSMSAPSHKQVFDHAALYPPSLGLGSAAAAAAVTSSSGGPGPVRRYRSVTPTIARNNENIRRPSTSATDSLTGAIARAYHPYAAPSGQYNSGSTGSNHSSPVPYHTTTDYQASLDQQQRALSRQGSSSHSRSNSLNTTTQQQQQQQLLSVDAADASSLYSDVTSSAAVGYGQYAAATGEGVGVGGAGYYGTGVSSESHTASPHQGLYSVGDVGINEAGQYQSSAAAAVVPSSYYDASDRSGSI